MKHPQNPFVGLRSFESADALYYFGRAEQTGALLQNLFQTRFLAVTGSSGSGKSSLVRAGLIPHLEAGFLVQDRDIWHIAKMKPGDSPLFNLAQALARSICKEPYLKNMPDLAESIIHEGIQALLEFLTPVLSKGDSSVFILIDQFEEVFRFGLETGDNDKEDEAAIFVDLLLRLANQTELPIYVCLTMRSDYIGECDMFHGLPEALNRSQYLVPRLTRSQRREAIEAPIRISGAKISPRLLDRLLNESGESRDDLPILQHALMRTWNEWANESHGPIDISHYERIGTMKNALSGHAEEALKELTDQEIKLTKRLFQTLTETDSGNRRLRHPAHLKEITAVMDVPVDKVMRIIEKFQEDNRCFLILSSNNPADNPLVDISHESLMRQWGTLRIWMEEEANSARIYKRLAETAELNRLGKAGFYTGLDLTIAMQWRFSSNPSKEWAKRYYENFDAVIEFLEKSDKVDENNIKKDFLQRQKRQNITRNYSIIISIVLVLFLIFGYKLILQNREVERQREIFEQQTIELKSQRDELERQKQIALQKQRELEQSGDEIERQTLTANYNKVKVFEEKVVNALKSKKLREAWLYMGAAFRQKISKDKFHLRSDLINTLLSPEVINTAFSEKWVSPPSESHNGTVNCVAFSPNGQIIASGSNDKYIFLRDSSTGKLLRRIYNESETVSCIAFSADGKTIASGSLNNSIYLWDVNSGKKIGVLAGHIDTVNCLAFNWNGKIIASGSNDNNILFWNLETNKIIRKINGHTSAVTCISFSPKGNRLASGSEDNTIRLWDTGNENEIRVLGKHSHDVTSIAFSTDGSYLVSGSIDRTICTWDVISGNRIHEFRGHSAAVTSVAIIPDKKIILSGSEDNTIRIWNVDSGLELQTLIGHTQAIRCIAYSSKGKNLVSGSEDRTVRLWNIATENKVSTTLTPINPANSIAFNPIGKHLASGSLDNTISIWNITTGKIMFQLNGHTDSITQVIFSPNGNTLASASIDQTIRLWDVKSHEEKMQLNGHSAIVTCITFSPDGESLVSGSADNTIKIWDMETGDVLLSIPKHKKSVTSVAFSPSEIPLASGAEDKTIRLWDPVTGEELKTIPVNYRWITSIQFTPDGKTLASGSEDNYTYLWDINSGKKTRTFSGHSGGVTNIDISPDGKTLASASRDKTIRLWDISSGREIRCLVGHSNDVLDISFNPDGTAIASCSDDGTIRLWDLNIFNLFLENGKPTPLFYAFSEGIEFFWGFQLEGLEYVPKPKNQEYNQKFLPLLNPPNPGQTKFEQILEWAKKQN